MDDDATVQHSTVQYVHAGCRDFVFCLIGLTIGWHRSRHAWYWTGPDYQL